jgi:ElaB/YqjD/DUF883 family membrane-anchored ribosome-binding protein
MADLKRVVRDSEELLHDSADAMGDKARELRLRLAETLERAKAACGRLQEKTKETAKATDKAIRENPYPAIGVAFGLGLVVGWLVLHRD